MAFSAPPVLTPTSTPPVHATSPLRAHEVEPTLPWRAQCAEVEPLTAGLRRLHLTVSTGFLEKLAAVRTGLSHSAPRATMEEALEAALDLLLERQARRKALVKRPRRMSTSTPPKASDTSSMSARPERSSAGAESRGTSTSTPKPRPHVPAPIEREVRLRDGDRCQFPLDAGGACGSTWQVELDHVVPVALGGETSAANLRCACRVHNRLAATRELGPAVMSSARRPPRSEASGE